MQVRKRLCYHLGFITAVIIITSVTIAVVLVSRENYGYYKENASKEKTKRGQEKRERGGGGGEQGKRVQMKRRRAREAKERKSPGQRGGL